MSDAYAVKRYSRAQFGERLVRELLELDDCSPTQWRGGHMLCVCVFMLIAVPSPRVPCGCFLLCCHHPGAEMVLRLQQNFSSNWRRTDQIPSAPPAHLHNLNLSPRHGASCLLGELTCCMIPAWDVQSELVCAPGGIQVFLKCVLKWNYCLCVRIWACNCLAFVTQMYGVTAFCIKEQCQVTESPAPGSTLTLSSLNRVQKRNSSYRRILNEWILQLLSDVSQMSSLVLISGSKHHHTIVRPSNK